MYFKSITHSKDIHNKGIAYFENLYSILGVIMMWYFSRKNIDQTSFMFDWGPSCRINKCSFHHITESRVIIFHQMFHSNSLINKHLWLTVWVTCHYNENARLYFIWKDIIKNFRNGLQFHALIAMFSKTRTSIILFGSIK